jgi:type II secretory pathway pseudopilin PulG
MRLPFVQLNRQAGATLIELLFALVLTGIITATVMRTYVIQHENYLVQDDVSVMQQSSRASIDELTRQIRMAGHHLPLGLPPIVAANTNPDTITITYHGNNCDTYLSDPMPQPSAELKCGSDITCFETDQWVYIYEPDSAVGEWFQISEVQGDAFHIQHRYDPKELSRCYGADALVLALNQVKFFIDNTTDPDNPKLMIQREQHAPQPYADHIVDLQFRYRLANGTIVDVPVLLSDVREVLISVTAASTLVDPDQVGDQQQDRKVRTYTSSASLRNLDI